MARWETGARERLQAAALELYGAHGFEQTTVAQIASSVGLTERTFFRYFADKREVLFDTEHRLDTLLREGVETAPADAGALEMVAIALRISASLFPDERRGRSRIRQGVIDGTPALQERELLKLAGLGTTLSAALRGRGVAEPTATLAAQSGVTVFSVAFGLWVGSDETRSLWEIEEDVLARLAGVTTTSAPTDRASAPRP